MSFLVVSLKLLLGIPDRNCEGEGQENVMPFDGLTWLSTGVSTTHVQFSFGFRLF